MKTSKFDAAEYLETPEAQDAYLREALARGDDEEVRDALDIVARAKGMTDVAEI